MVKKYAVRLVEFTWNEDEQGWDEKATKLLLFDDEDEASEAMISYFEQQDSDYKVESKNIGYIEVPEVSVNDAILRLIAQAEATKNAAWDFTTEDGKHYEIEVRLKEKVA